MCLKYLTWGIYPTLFVVCKYMFAGILYPSVLYDLCMGENRSNGEQEPAKFMEGNTFIIAGNTDLSRLGFIYIIREQFTLAKCVSASNLHELKNALYLNPKGTVILDFDGLSIDSIDEVTTLSETYPHASWLFTADFADESFLMPLTALFNKANFVLKINDSDVIATAILDTILGKKYYCSEALHVIMHGYNRKKETLAKRSLLTTTELELVLLFSQGKTAKEIARQRCLSHHTINTHRKNIFRKLDINNVQELIKYALKNGLVDLTEYYI